MINVSMTSPNEENSVPPVSTVGPRMAQGGYEGSINIKRSWCPTRNAQKLRLFGKFGLLKVSSR